MRILHPQQPLARGPLLHSLELEAAEMQYSEHRAALQSLRVGHHGSTRPERRSRAVLETARWLAVPTTAHILVAE